jgi:hypothetical protein
VLTSPKGKAARAITATIVMTLVSSLSLHAQVGLSSGSAQVLLVARAAPHAALPSVSTPRKLEHRNGLTHASVNVHMSGNRGYRLVVRSDASSASRVWVRGLDAQYRELVPGIAVTVAEEEAGRAEHEVSYKLQTDAPRSSITLPVRYEILVDPII